MTKLALFSIVLAACAVTESDSSQALLGPILPPQPIRLPPAIGQVVGLDAPVSVPAQGIQEYPAIACGPTSCLAVWEDRRNRPGPWWTAGEPDIYGVRYTIGGAGLEAFDIAISTAARSQVKPTVTWDGTQFFVAWQDFRNDNYDLFGARVTSGGAVLDPDGIPLIVASGSQTNPQIGSDGTHRVLVWEDTRGDGHDIASASISATGIASPSTGGWVVATTRAQRNPSIAGIPGGAGFVVAWDDERAGVPDGAVGFEADIFGTRLLATGAPSPFNGVPISTAGGNQRGPTVAAGGVGSGLVMVAWEDGRTATAQVVGTTVGLTTPLTVTFPTGFAIDADPSDSYAPSIGFGAGAFRVAFQRGSSGHVFSRAITTTGSAGAAVAHVEIGQPHHPAVGCTPIACGVLWDDTRNDMLNGWNERDIFAMNANGTGTASAISTGANGQIEPSLAWDGTQYLAVWQDFRGNGLGDIYGVRLDASGAVIDAAPIALCTDVGDQGEPQVAFDGSDFAVVWHDAREFTAGSVFYEIRGTRVAPDGTVANPDGIVIHSGPDAQMKPRIACGATGDCLVVWLDRRNPSNDDVYGARWSAAGVLDPAGITIATAASDERQPSVGWNGAGYLVAWDRQSGFSRDIFATRVDTAGVVAIPNGTNITSTSGDQTRPEVAFGGGTWLVAWEDTRVDPTADIYAGRLSSFGLPVDGAGFEVATEVLGQRAPAVAFDGTHFLIAWTDERNGDEDIYATRVSPGAVRIDGDGNAFAIAATREAAPTLASDGAGHWLLGWNAFLHAPAFGATRARVALLTNR